MSLSGAAAKYKGIPLNEAFAFLEALDVSLPDASDALMRAINAGRLVLDEERNLAVVDRKPLLPHLQHHVTRIANGADRSGDSSTIDL